MRWSIVCLLVLSVSLSGAFQQEKKKDLRGTLPPLYRKLDLQEEQVRKLYKIRADYWAKVAELERQIKKLNEEQAAEMEKVLTAEQQKKLKELRTGEKAPEK